MSQGTTGNIAIVQSDAVPTNGSSNPVSSNGVFDALALKSPLASPTFTGTVTLPSTTSIGPVSSTEIGYVDGVTSAIQTQIDARLVKAKYISSINGSVTGVTGTQVIASVLIPANTYASGESFELVIGMTRSATIATTTTWQVYHGTSVNSTTFSLGSNVMSPNIRMQGYSKWLSISGTTLLIYSSLSNQFGTTSTISTNTTFNPAVDNWITLTANPTLSAEVHGFTVFAIRPL